MQRLDYNIIYKGYQRPQIALVRRRHHAAQQRALAVSEEVCDYEDEHQIATRWVPGSKEYEEALLLMGERNYRIALDRLESLVVKRLFELTKLGMSGVGAWQTRRSTYSDSSIAYKMREKISQALRTRAEAIRTALAKYNVAASQLNPPRPALTWAAVIDTVTLADFDLLRDTRTDIRKLSWAQPANREAMVLHFGIQRAKEEIRRLNVEIVRLISFMVDDHVDYIRAIRSHVMEAPNLASELSRQWEHRTRIHKSIALKLIKTSRLAGFSGSLFPANRLGRDAALNESERLPSWATMYLGLVRQTVEYEEPDSEDDIPRPLVGADELMVDLMERLDAVELDN
jgi:hypothetical protein